MEQIFSLKDAIQLVVYIVVIAMAFTRLQSGVNELKASQKENRDDIDRIDDKLRVHLADVERHIDPLRDNRSYQELQNRLSRIEEGIETLKRRPR